MVQFEGLLQLKVGPVFWLTDTKLVLAGTALANETLAAVSGPLFLTRTKKTASLPAAGLFESGRATSLTSRSTAALAGL